MVVIIEGPDAVGKSTQIQLIKNYAEKELDYPVHILHYSNIKAFGNDGPAIENASYKLYSDMFKLMETSERQNLNRLLILDRAHLGETVYSPIYRGYNGDYVLSDKFEGAYNKTQAAKNTYLILFTDSVDSIIERDKKRGDGLSFSLDKSKKADEIERFENAFNLSGIPNKLMIKVGTKTPDEIFNGEVVPFLRGDK